MMKVVPFKVDVTPEIGFPLAYGINQKKDSPIYISGVIVDDRDSRVAFVCADFLYFAGKIYTQWQKMIAEASGTIPTKVFLHAVHQHDSVRANIEYDELCRKYLGKEVYPKEYNRRISKLVSDEIRRLVKPRSGAWKKVWKISTSEHRLSKLASNRRLLDKNNRIYAMRWSMCYDKKLQAHPAGVFDPMLRTVGFIDSNRKLIAAMHYYASHPMVAYNRNMVSSDVPGLALNYVEKNSSDHALNIFFNGCGGDVTFGKYTFKNKNKSLKVLGKRLGEGLLKNLQRFDYHTPGNIKIKAAKFDFPLSNEIPMATEEDFQRAAISEGEGFGALAHNYIAMRDWKKWSKPSITRVSLSDGVHILSMPGEMCVEYQLYAQSLLPEDFIACAAYANCYYRYIPTAEMYDEGGYEPESGSITTPDIEAELKNAILKVLKS